MSDSLKKILQDVLDMMPLAGAAVFLVMLLLYVVTP